MPEISDIKLQNSDMKYLSHIPSLIKNKYLIAGLAFIVWISFFDKNDMYTQYQRYTELKELQQSKAFYTREIASERNELQQLKSNPASLEKYAREKYLMKRDNEDLFLVPEK